ncbi:peroxidase 4-like [Pyrus x bretschneideri]|uniref:peroxidase 4-like n=1 Tax=Pyrus x bretschneideri TaxID=225117 RepID=UPI002030D87B|nr:peroxidase 4-like [Pyrus x bretschneideri]
MIYWPLALCCQRFCCHGSHTKGQARRTIFRPGIYNETNVDRSFAKTRESNCPKTYGSGNNNLAPLDLQSPTVFDNHYYKTLIKNKGLLWSDQQLFDGGSTNSTVRAYSKSYDTFSSDCECHDQDGRYQTPHWISWGY